jgi:hypothetical protein
MKRSTTILLYVFACLSMLATTAHAQTKIGAHVGFDANDSNVALGVNAVFTGSVKLGESAIRYNPEASYFFVDNVTFMVFSINFLYPFAVEAVDLYAGAGILLSLWSFDGPDLDSFLQKTAAIQSQTDTSFGLNVKGGGEFGNGKMRPFGEVGYYVKDGGFLYLQGGLRFLLGG